MSKRLRSVRKPLKLQIQCSEKYLIFCWFSRILWKSQLSEHLSDVGDTVKACKAADRYLQISYEHQKHLVAFTRQHRARVCSKTADGRIKIWRRPPYSEQFFSPTRKFSQLEKLNSLKRSSFLRQQKKP